MADILTTIRLQADQYLQEGKKVEDQLRAIVQQEQAEGKQVTVTNAELAKAAKERNALLTKEKQNLADLEKLKKGAFTTKEIEQYNSVISKTQKNIDTLKGATSGIEKQNSLLNSSFAKLGGIIAAAFSVHQIVALGKATVDAFIKGELEAKKLQTAIGAGGGLQKDFNFLIQQSKELQKISIFPDEQIQAAQTLALQFGLSAEAVKNLIPLIIDFASATGQDLNSALSTVLRGIEGQARGLKVYGIEVNSSATRAERFASIIDQLNNKFEGQGKIVSETVGGRLKQLANAWEDLKESIGSAIAPLVSGIATFAKSLLAIAEIPLSKKLQEEQTQLELTAIKLSSLNEGSAERIKIIKELQSQYPQYLGNINAEKVSNEELQKALKKVNDELVLKIALAKGDEDIAKAQEKVADAALKASEQERILISQIKQRLEQSQKSRPIFTDALKIQLQGLTLDQQAILIQKNGLDISGKILEAVNNRVKAEDELKKTQDQLTQAQQNRIAEEERLRGLLNIPVGEKETLTDKGAFDKKTEEELKAEKDAAQKKLEARQKDAKETRDAQASLRKQAISDELDNITKEETLRKIAANKEIKDEQELNQVLRLIQIEQDVKRRNFLIENGEDTTEIDKKIADEIIANRKATEKEITDNVEEGLNERIQAIEEAAAKELDVLGKKNLSNEDFEREKLLLTKRTLEAEVTEYIKAGKDISDILKQIADINKKLSDDIRQKTIENTTAILQTVADAANEINSLLQAQTDERVENINKEKDARLSAIDEEIAKLEEQHQKGRIGDTAFERNKQALIEKRAAAEKNYDEQVRKQKRKQAEIDKQLAIFNVILNTAQSIAKVLGNPVLTALAIAAGAVQLAVAISTPIPQFKHGTRGKKGTGLALVGEQGPELAFLPTGAKVLPANRTQQYGQFIDAMFDNRLDDFINRRYVEPALKNRESVNINFNDRNMLRELREIKNKDSLRIENLHELASMFEQANLRRII